MRKIYFLICELLMKIEEKQINLLNEYCIILDYNGLDGMGLHSGGSRVVSEFRIRTMALQGKPNQLLKSFFTRSQMCRHYVSFYCFCIPCASVDLKTILQRLLH